jgi:hypothetical protein
MPGDSGIATGVPATNRLQDQEFFARGQIYSSAFRTIGVAVADALSSISP